MKFQWDKVWLIIHHLHTSSTCLHTEHSRWVNPSWGSFPTGSWWKVLAECKRATCIAPLQGFRKVLYHMCVYPQSACKVIRSRPQLLSLPASSGSELAVGANLPLSSGTTSASQFRPSGPVLWMGLDSANLGHLCTSFMPHSKGHQVHMPYARALLFYMVQDCSSDLRT